MNATLEITHPFAAASAAGRVPYKVRDLTVDESADRPTVWIPVYRPPSRMVKVHVR